MKLVRTKRTDPRLLERMAVHYSQPKGFVGRVLAYAIEESGAYFGHIIAGSAVRHLPGRTADCHLNEIVNNVFFNCQKVGGSYPTRNFTTKVVAAWRERTQKDWSEKYGDDVLFFETLIELPRSGELYRRDGWKVLGQTKGFTCKRVASDPDEASLGNYRTSGRDSWSGRRVWNTVDLRPKLVLGRPA